MIGTSRQENWKYMVRFHQRMINRSISHGVNAGHSSDPCFVWFHKMVFKGTYQFSHFVDVKTRGEKKEELIDMRGREKLLLACMRDARGRLQSHAVWIWPRIAHWMPPRPDQSFSGVQREENWRYFFSL